MILERCRIFGKPVLVQSGVNEAWTHNGVPLLSNSISAKDKFNSYSAICILLASLRDKIFTDLIKLKTITIRYSYNGLWASVLEEGGGRLQEHKERQPCDKCSKEHKMTPWRQAEDYPGVPAPQETMEVEPSKQARPQSQTSCRCRPPELTKWLLWF